MKASRFFLLWCVLVLSPLRVLSAEAPPLEGVRRVVFLGDSITYSGGFIDFVEAFLRIKQPELHCEFLNFGLPSETVSGLSEPGHAGGQFPRPELRERLDRVLEQTHPELVVACYGMNDGIYHPFDETRFARFQDGIKSLRDRVERSGARIVLLTPPVFDPLPLKGHTLPAGQSEYRMPYEGYDSVLDQYAKWLMSQNRHGWNVVDIHEPMKRFLESQRRQDPNYRLADDGVHLGPTGHWLIARELLKHWGVPSESLEGASGDKILEALPHGAEVFKLVARRQAILKDAWLSATGHKRPGMNRGVSLGDARRQAQEIEARLQRQLRGG